MDPRESSMRRLETDRSSEEPAGVPHPRESRTRLRNRRAITLLETDAPSVEPAGVEADHAQSASERVEPESPPSESLFDSIKRFDYELKLFDTQNLVVPQRLAIKRFDSELKLFDTMNLDAPQRAARRLDEMVGPKDALRISSASSSTGTNSGVEKVHGEADLSKRSMRSKLPNVCSKLSRRIKNCTSRSDVDD
ncbi:hypothetical protein KP509_03G054400 [Ceratopteris richardii]|uniref:Uncharacterized protein n=1 Tax=Ceratopteris richardii TaxID=49495 RepID=A0A8T2V449_CERRI|nr:hypothetical protein KP509_03G054400 [Ceratopteris richardii]